LRRKKDAPETNIGDPAPTLIREQIDQMAPATFADMASAPENTDTEAQPLRGPNGRTLRKDGTERAAKGSRKRATENDDPLMNDPRYVEAIQGLNFYGAPRILKRGFKATAGIMKDKSIELSIDEEKNVDNYFYALSKHMTFDPMSSLIGRLLLFTLLMGELILWRYLKYSPLGEQLQKMLKADETDKEPPTNDNSPIM
jgi:hypothetical protein